MSRAAFRGPEYAAHGLQSLGQIGRRTGGGLEGRLHGTRIAAENLPPRLCRRGIFQADEALGVRHQRFKCRAQFGQLLTHLVSRAACRDRLDKAF